MPFGASRVVRACDPLARSTMEWAGTAWCTTKAGWGGGPRGGCSDAEGAPAWRRRVGHHCQFESLCERCGFFDTGPEFIPILAASATIAAEHGDADRSDPFNSLLSDISDEQSSSFS